MMKSVKSFLVELAIYITNHIVNKIPFHWIRQFWYTRAMNFDIHRAASIHLGACFDTRGQFKLGEGSTVNEKCRLDNRGGLEIGEHVSISSEVMILTASHAVNSSDFGGDDAAVFIADYAWIGARAIILPGTRIGRGAVVGAGAVVTGDVGEYQIVAGSPARVIGQRSKDLTYSAYYRRLFH